MTSREIRDAERLAETYSGYSPSHDPHGWTCPAGYSPDKDEFDDPDAPDSFRIALHIALSVVICVLLIAVGFVWGSR